MQKEIIADLYFVRSQLGKLSPETETSAEQQILQQKERILAAIKDKGNDLLLELTSFRQHLIAKLGKPSPSSAYLCANFVNDTMVEGFWKFALNDQEARRYNELGCDFDIAYGMSTTLNRIFIAESYRKTGDTLVREGLGEAEQYNARVFEVLPPIGDSMEVYIFAQASAKWATDLFNKDLTGSGFKLLDAYVEQLRTAPNKPLEFDQIPGGVSHRLIVAGAEYARDLYKAVYPFSEQVVQTVA